jgi:hypothetical protein
MACYDSASLSGSKEFAVSLQVQTLLATARNLPADELDELIVALLAQRDADARDSSNAVAAAWDEEIARRVDEMERGAVAWVDGDEALARLRASLLDSH